MASVLKNATEWVDVGEHKQNVEKVIRTVQSKLETAADSADALLSGFSQRVGVNFAPIKIPIARRRQTLVVFIQLSMYWLCIALNIWAFRCWTGIPFYLYILFLGYKLTSQTYHMDGGLPIPWLRNMFWWQWYADYFPITLHKMTDLNPDQSYLFGYHPHGIIGLGAWGTFAATPLFTEKFPAIDVRLVTLKINFVLPFFDLFLSFMGVAEASKESISAHLSQGAGKAVAIVLGGAKESLDAHPGRATLFLRNRKGFVKLALKHGSSLVPVFGFGENELYSQVANPKGSRLRNIQETLQKRMGFAIPLVMGRGVFQYNFGYMPQRKPLNVVFGEPVPCPQVPYEEITSALIDEYHQRYLDSLRQMYETYKEQFGIEGDLEFI